MPVLDNGSDGRVCANQRGLFDMKRLRSVQREECRLLEGASMLRFSLFKTGKCTGLFTNLLKIGAIEALRATRIL